MPRLPKIIHEIAVAAALLVACNARAQSSMDAIYQLPDTATAFSIDAFYRIILDHHPVVKQAELLTEAAQQDIRLARGSFDPKLEFSLERKESKGKTYYDLQTGQLYFPTRSPITPKVGYEQARGEELDPSKFIPGDVQYFAGFNLPIGRGLFTDERRTALRQAQLFQNLAEAEQVKMINKILLDAAKDYWAWYHAYYNFRLMNQGADIAREIFRRVKLNAQLGEAAPLDTVQAKITLQTRLVERQEALLQFQNSGILLSNYLWDENANPLQLSQRLAPVVDTTTIAPDLQVLSNLADQARTNHPELVKLRTKVSQLEADRFLAREFLKPKLDFNYSMLALPSEVGSVSPTADYKLGVDFSMPLFLRKERSKLALTNIKIRNTNWQQSQAEREIINEINTTFNELTNTQVILGQQTEMVDLYDRLLRGELINLENGESDLFKINIQQEKLIQSQSKLLKLKADFEKNKAQLYWAAGTPNLGLR
jgi:outer membrane protein TolC